MWNVGNHFRSGAGSVTITERIRTLEPRRGHGPTGRLAPGNMSRLTSSEWDAVKDAVLRNVSLGEIYAQIPEVAERYTLRGFYRAAENRLGSLPELRRRSA